VQNGWTDLNDLYVVWRASAQGGAIWGRDVSAPHFGTTIPKTSV